MKRTGLHKWTGKSRDAKGCEFPYRVYEVREWGWVERKYLCPWWEDEVFDSLEELKSWVSKK